MALSLDARLDRVWGNLAGSLARHQRRQRTRRGVAVGAGVTALALVGLSLWRGSSPAEEWAVQAPLSRVGGAVLLPERVVAAGEPVLLSDGSRLGIPEDARLAVKENAPRRFVTRLDEGRVRFHVKPTPATRRRAWKIRAGHLLVEVIGTQFVVTRSDALVRVEVQHGKVRVTGVDVPNGATTLTAGEAFESRLPLAPETVARTGLVAMGDRSEDDNMRVDSFDSATALEGRELDADILLENAAGGDGVEDSRVPGPSDSPTELADASVLGRSDTLRRSGRPREAAVLLRRALMEDPQRADAAVLAFTLGRIELDLLGQPRSAARSFARARRSGLSATLREQSVAREVQAWAAVGNHDRAKDLARRYLRRFPQGPNRDLVLRWLERIGDR